MAKLNALYSKALFELAIEGGTTDEILEHAFLVRDAMLNTGCKKILTHPHISKKDKHGFLSSVFGGRIHDQLFNLMRLSIDKNREAFLVPALDSLIAAIHRHQGKATADVVSASGLDKKQLSALKRMLSSKLDKTVDISVKVDPALVGGPFIRVDGYYIDQTVKTKLRNLAASMKEGCSA